MSTLLRIAAAVSLTWAVVLWCCKPIVFGLAASEPLSATLADSLAVVQVAWAFVLWRAAAAPASERSIIYGALIVFGLRVVRGTYGILYGFDGAPAIVNLVDMATGLALFVGILNALPQTLQAAREKGAPREKGG